LEYEATRFAELAGTSVSSALRGIFLGESMWFSSLLEGSGWVRRACPRCRHDGAQVEQVRGAGDQAQDGGHPRRGAHGRRYTCGVRWPVRASIKTGLTHMVMVGGHSGCPRHRAGLGGEGLPRAAQGSRCRGGVEGREVYRGQPGREAEEEEDDQVRLRLGHVPRHPLDGRQRQLGGALQAR
jgi:hypothetical protein